MVKVLVLYEDDAWRKVFETALKRAGEVRVDFVDIKDLRGKTVESLPDIIAVETARGKEFLERSVTRLKRRFASARFMLFLDHVFVSDIAFSHRLGVSALLSTRASQAQMESAFEAALKGDLYIDACFLRGPSLDQVMPAQTQPADQPLSRDLSQREIEVLELVSKGFSNKRIAETLFISEKTVKNHMYSIFRKIGVSDRTKAALFGLRRMWAQDSASLFYETYHANLE